MNRTTIVTAVINDEVEVEVEVTHDYCPGDRWTPSCCSHEITDYGTSSKKYRQIIDENEDKFYEAEDYQRVYIDDLD